MEGWKKVKLKDILIEGSKEKVEDTSKYQKLTIKLNFKGMEKSKVRDNMADRRPFYIRRKGEIVIGKQNYFNGSIAILPEELDGGICSNAIMSFNTKPNYNSKYIYYMLSDINFINKRSFIANGTGQKELSEKDFLNFDVIVPPIEEQEKIVKIFNNIDNVINKYKEINNELDKEKTAIFNNLLNNQRFMKKKVKDVADIYLGLTHKPKYIEDGVKFLSSQNISGGYLDLDNVKYISQDEFNRASDTIKPKRGDVLFSRVGSNLGNPVIVDTDVKFGIYVSLGYLRSKEGTNNKYLKQWINSKEFYNQVRTKVSGGAKNNINTGWLKEFIITMPQEKEQEIIANFLDKIDEKRNLINNYVEQYDTLKKGLMQQLLTGKVRVKI